MPALAFVLEVGEGGTRHHRLGFLLQLGDGNIICPLSTSCLCSGTCLSL
jgi:hypothetical protein